MKRMLFNATHPEELRVASIENKRLINFDVESSSKTQVRGNIYKGIITRVEPSLEACFVEYGSQKQGFLPFKAIDSSCIPGVERGKDLSKLKEGLEVIVQVEKDERGNKGAALTTYISLPGRYLVLMTNNVRSSGVSRRIEGEDRDELKATIAALDVPDNMSVIGRTAALGRNQEELQWDLNYLIKLCQAIKDAANKQSGAFLIYQESSLIIRSIRDHFSPDITEILIDKIEIYEQAKQFMAHVMPNFVNRVKLYKDDIPIFTRFQIESQIESAYGRSITLSSGGVIAIDPTEALTAIDVNSARANKATDIEATALATNLEAAGEIARQMRLRDLGGLIVVDFIDMENPKNQREVENYFKEELSFDRARIQMSRLSKFGLIELSRQRLQSSLDESTSVTCPRCLGVGTIRGTESAAVHVLRVIEDEVSKNNSTLIELHIQLPVSVATYLLNEKREDVIRIESRVGIKLIIIPNIHLESPNYKLRRITSEADAQANRGSYNLVETPELDTNSISTKKDSKIVSAAVKGVDLGKPAPMQKSLFNLFGLFVRLIQSVKQNLNQAPEESIAKPVKTAPKRINQRSSGNNRPSASSVATKPVSKTLVTKSVTNTPPNQNKSANNKKTVAVGGNDKAGNTKVNTGTDNNKVPRANRNPRVSKANPTNSNTNASLNNNNTSPIAKQRLEESVNESNDEVIIIKPKPLIKDTNAINQSWTNSVDTTPPVADSVITSAPSSKPINSSSVEDIANNSQVKSKPAQLNKRSDKFNKKIDLGDLQVVATNNEKHSDQSVVIPAINTKPATRYNDVIDDKAKSIAKLASIEYEMVGTKPIDNKNK